ncbi:septum formation family protein [Micromonospora sp. LAH09]|uniref:septum formation family protein n=1 Tax=Micromonospora cabrerizensis TaxID=2911213 RepID=UPI001EE8E4E6|nr:septum formation family protein [Micromonospora cabrerizensis]MCG5471487.1 septum formation family protein [Micromonospora cabrerizensis]
MRRWWGTTILTALIVGTGGCDGGSAEEPTSAFAPKAGGCHATASDERSPEAYTPIPCSSKHEAETFLVGRISGAEGAAPKPPAADSDGLWRLYESCDSEAARFLGGEWRESRLAMRTLTPSATRWEAGERWYRCDLLEMHAVDRWFPNPRANSLRGALTGDSPLRYTCFTELAETGDLPPASCTGPHETEFAGIWRADPEVEELTDDITKAGCLSTVSRYVGLPEGDLGSRFQVFGVSPEGEPEWLAGTLSVLCFLYSPGRALDSSAKGGGRALLAAAR